VTSVLTFSVALGGVCTVAALAYSILRPLPYPDSERLVAVWETRDGEDRWVAPANYLDWRRSAESFQGLAAHDTRAVSVTVGEVATRDRVAVVSGNFFDVLGVRAVQGRTFDPGLDTRFPERVAVLSHRAWSEAFAADPRVLGRTFLVEDRSYEVVGVMPDGLAFPDPDLFAWLRSPTEAPGIAGFGGDVTTMRDAWYFEVVGRLAQESDAHAAGAEMDALTARLAELHPDTNRGHGARVIPLLAQSVAGAGPILLGLSLAVVIMLLAACLNVTHLTLARSEARAREVAIKRSLGATRGDVGRQVLVEASILSLAGGAVGLIVAVVALTYGAEFLTVLPRRAEMAVRPGVAALTMLLALGVGTAVALASWRLGFSRGRTRLAGLGGARGARSVRDDLAGARSLPGGMVALQVAGAIALLCVTGLMARSVHALASVDPGFEPEDLLTFRVALPDAPTRTYAERVSIYESVAREVRGLPGVGAVGVGSDSPLATGLRAGVFLDGDRTVDDPPSAGWQPVDVGYFEAFGMRLLAGRAFTAADIAAAPHVAIANEAFARLVGSAGPAVGARVTMGLDGHDRPLTIVGIVADTRTGGPAAPPFPVLYRPLPQTDRFSAASLLVAVRTEGGRGPGLAALRSTVRSSEPGLPLYAEAAGHDLARPFRRSQAMLLATLGAFATTNVLLALVGVYGVTAHEMGRRRREIGVRLALGAEPRSVTAHLAWRGVRTASAGVPVGIVLTLLLGKIFGSLLFGVAPSDPATLVGASAVVLATVAAAVYLPARTAARTDPAETTRSG
jgi:putative ABC transport system permease protein